MSRSLEFDILKKLMHNLLMEKKPEDTLPTEINADPELAEFFQDLYAIRNALSALSSGDLGFTIKGKGPFIGTLKSFQAAMRHLTWQTKAISMGDFNQKVDFFGEFSDSFNQMTQSLDKAIKQIKKSAQEYKQLFDNAAEAILVVQKDNLLLFNPMFCTLTGYTNEEISQLELFSFIHDDDHKIAERILTFQMEEKQIRFTFRIVRKDGGIRWVECKGIPIIWSDQAAHLYFLNDITKQKIAMAQMKESERNFKLIAEHSSDTVWIYNISQRKLTYVSPSIYYMMGYKPEEFINLDLRDYISPTTYENAKRVFFETLEQLKKNPAKRGVLTIEVQAKTRENGYSWMEISANIRYNSSGEIELVGSNRSIDKRKEKEEMAVYLSNHDPLTGLYNRRFYEEEFLRVDMVKNLPISLVMADVNGLKLINDAFGHDVGDALIFNFADILKRHSQSSDIIARIGGDEFIMLMKNTDLPNVESIISNIKKAIRDEADSGIIISASFGAAVKKTPEESLDKVFQEAETNMYYEKLVESKIMKNNTILRIQNMLYDKSEYIKRHSENVSQLCRLLGTAMMLDNAMVDELELLGIYHDIGKIAVGDEILNKKEPLTEVELSKVRRHAEIGYQILRSSSVLAHLADSVLAHHERVDGMGYPRRLKGNEIPLQAKILAVAEAYDFMTGDAPGNKSMTMEEACRNLVSNAGTHYDSEAVTAFVERIQINTLNKYE